MYESLGSQFFRTATGIPSGPDAFDDPSFVLTFLTVLGVMEKLYSFRFVLEGETGKEIPDSSRLELLEKFLQTILLCQMQKTTPPGRCVEDV